MAEQDTAEFFGQRLHPLLLRVALPGERRFPPPPRGRPWRCPRRSSDCWRRQESLRVCPASDLNFATFNFPIDPDQVWRYTSASGRYSPNPPPVWAVWLASLIAGIVASFRCYVV